MYDFIHWFVTQLPDNKSIRIANTYCLILLTVPLPNDPENNSVN